MVKNERRSKNRRRDDRSDIMVRKPYRNMTDIDYMFNRFRSDIEHLIRAPYDEFQTMRQSSMETPFTDIADHGDRYEVYADMPGIPKENINIEVSSNSIEISADYQQSSEEEDKNWLRRERSNMNYYRSFDLPETIRSDEVDAELNHGVLTIKIPKSEPRKRQETKKVNIK